MSADIMAMEDPLTLAGLQVSGRSLELLTALKQEDQSVSVDILIEIYFQCKVCQTSLSCDAESVGRQPQNWNTLDEIKEHLSTRHLESELREELPSSNCDQGKVKSEQCYSTCTDIACVETSQPVLPLGSSPVGIQVEKCKGLARQVTTPKRRCKVRHGNGKHRPGKQRQQHLPECGHITFATPGNDRDSNIMNMDAEKICTFREDIPDYTFFENTMLQDSVSDADDESATLVCQKKLLLEGNNAKDAKMDSVRVNDRKLIGEDADSCDQLECDSYCQTDGKGAASELLNKDASVDPSAHSQSKCRPCNKTKTCAECHALMESVEECIIHFMEKHDTKSKLHVLKPLVPKENISGDMSRWFTCPLCKKKFKYNTLLKHIVLIHMWRPAAKRRISKKDHLCALCGKVFHCDQNYYYHLRQVHTDKKRKSLPYKPKQYKCTQCEYTSCEQRRIASHMKFVHSGIKAYSCQHCSYSTWERTSMRSHMYRHQANKKYACEHCSYQCIQKKQLRAHMLHKHDLQLPKTGTTRLPARKGPRQTFKPDVELTNRGTDPVKSKKSARKRTQETSSDKSTRASPRRDSIAASKSPLASTVKPEPTKSWTLSTPQQATEQYSLYPSASVPYIMGPAVQSSQEGLQVLANVSSTNLASTTHLPEQVQRVQYSQGALEASVMQAGPSAQEPVVQMGVREVQESTMCQYQTASLIYQPQAILTAKPCPQMLQVDQPVTFVSGSLPEGPGAYDRAPVPQRLTLENPGSVGMSTMKTPGQLGETITVTPIYAQTPERINTLNPTNSQGSFIYILK